MSDVETWGIVLRDRASGAEQWIACDVWPMGDGAWRARSKGMVSESEANSERGAVRALALILERTDPSLAFGHIETPAEYAAHMEGVCLTLAIDEANDLRAEVAQLRASIANREAVIADLRHAGNIAATAFARGAEAMREMAACDIAGWWQIFASEAATAATRIRALPLPAETPSQSAQSHEAPETPDAPQTVADATARARSAAAQRVASEAPVAAPDADAWVETWTDAGPRGLRVIRAALATAAPERWQAERLVEAAWLSRGRIDMGGDPLSMWHAIIDEAVLNERLDDLVAVARAKYPKCGL